MGIDKFGRHHDVDNFRSDQMVIDKFGRHIGGGDIVTATPPHPQAFPLTSDGNYDAENKRICNVGLAREDGDCVNKKYVDTSNVQAMSSISDLRVDIDEARTNLKELRSAQTDIQSNFNHLKKEVTTELTSVQKISTRTNKLQLDVDHLEYILQLTDKRLTTNTSDVKKELHHLKQRVHDIEQKLITPK